MNEIKTSVLNAKALYEPKKEVLAYGAQKQTYESWRNVIRNSIGE